MTSPYIHVPLTAAPSDSGMHVTATNKSVIAKDRMYQFVMFRSPGFLEIAAMTNEFPTIAVMFIMKNKGDSEKADRTLLFDNVDVNVILDDTVG